MRSGLPGESKHRKKQIRKKRKKRGALKANDQFPTETLYFHKKANKRKEKKTAVLLLLIQAIVRCYHFNLKIGNFSFH